jgi:hypothetical protein
MTTAEAVSYVRQTFAVEDAPARDQRKGWRYVVYTPGTAQRMTADDMRTFARNLRAFG